METLLKNDWEIITNSKGGDHGVEVYAANRKRGLVMQIPNEDLPVFGFKIAGPQSGIIGNYRTDNLEQQQICLRNIIDEQLRLVSTEVSFFTIEKYFNNHFEFKSKIERESMKRTLDLIRENFDKLRDFADHEFYRDYIKKSTS